MQMRCTGAPTVDERSMKSCSGIAQRRPTVAETTEAAHWRPERCSHLLSKASNQWSCLQVVMTARLLEALPAVTLSGLLAHELHAHEQLQVRRYSGMTLFLCI